MNESQSSMEMEIDQPSGNARSAGRALDILELLSNRVDGLTLSQIARELRIPPSSLHGILQVLVARRYLVSAGPKRHYRLGTKVLNLGAGYLGGTGLYAETRQLMHDLAEQTRETVHMAVLDDAHVVYLDTIEGSCPMRMISPLGERIPAHAAAAGKALLSLRSDAEIEALYQHEPLQSYTWRTIISLADLRREIDEVRHLGIAHDTEEFVEGLCCVAVPVADRLGHAAAISVSIPTARMTVEHSIELARLLQSYSSFSPPERLVRSMHTKQPRELRVAWSMGTMCVQAYEEMHRAAHVAARDEGIDLVWTNARDDLMKQAADMDRLLALQPDVILIHPVDTTQAETLFTQARDAHVPALCFQRPARTDAFDAFIGADTYNVGRMQVDFVAAQLGGRGNLVVIEGDPYNDNARNITQGVLDTVAHYPNLRVLVDQPARHWSPEAAHKIAAEALSRHGEEIHAFVVANDAMAGGVAEALLAHGLAGSIVLVGADGDETCLQRIRQGVQHGTAFQSPIDLAEVALSFASSAATGTLSLGTLPLRSIFHNPPGPMVRVRDVPYLFVSRDNLFILERYWSAVNHNAARTAAS